MSDRIRLRRLIQQNAYLSDSTEGRQITGDFCARFQVPNGERVRNFIHTGGYFSAENGDAVRALNLGLNPEASRAPGQKPLPRLAPREVASVLMSPSRLAWLSASRKFRRVDPTPGMVILLT